MASFSDRIYLQSPKPVQDVLVSVKGLQLELQRRRGRYPEFFRLIRQRNSYSREEFERYQLQRLQRVLEAAGRTVPYYRRAFAQTGVANSPVTTLADLARFPLLEKDQVRKTPEAFVPDGLDPNQLLKLNTTGTTGSPTVIYSTHEARQENYAHFDNFLLLAGLDPKGRRAVFGGRILQPGEDLSGPFWRRSVFQRTVFFSSYHMTEATLPRYFTALERFRPDLLEGYPSSLYRMAVYLLARGTPLPVQGVVTSSETLLERQRQAIESAFQCRVYDQYGAAEMCVFVGQCREGRYHVRPDYGVLEIIRDGAPVTPGEEGDLVCTGFINPAMPLIRYRIGDIGRWSADRCTCGLHTPILAEIGGRRDDVIVTPDGREVGRLSPVLKGFPVSEGQYVQDETGRLTVLLVPTAPLGPEVLAALEQELRKRVGPEIPVDFRTVEAIPRGPGGKFRAVISRYRRST